MVPTMFTGKDSIESILEKIIRNVEAECEHEDVNGNRALKRKLDKTKAPSNMAKKRRVTLHESIDANEIHCRICYDPNQEQQIIYPCKCKVHIIKKYFSDITSR